LTPHLWPLRIISIHFLSFPCHVINPTRTRGIISPLFSLLSCSRSFYTHSPFSSSYHSIPLSLVASLTRKYLAHFLGTSCNDRFVILTSAGSIECKYLSLPVLTGPNLSRGVLFSQSWKHLGLRLKIGFLIYPKNLLLINRIIAVPKLDGLTNKRRLLFFSSCDLQ
jgi:hypothetical protein